jgi:hypothetical protein
MRPRTLARWAPRRPFHAPFRLAAAQSRALSTRRSRDIRRCRNGAAASCAQRARRLSVALRLAIVGPALFVISKRAWMTSSASGSSAGRAARDGPRQGARARRSHRVSLLGGVQRRAILRRPRSVRRIQSGSARGIDLADRPTACRLASSRLHGAGREAAHSLDKMRPGFISGLATRSSPFHAKAVSVTLQGRWLTIQN